MYIITLTAINCTTYNASYFDFIIPSWTIGDKLCSSHDKTKLFLSSIGRIVFWWIVAFYVYKLDYKNVNICMYCWITINVVLSCIIIFKTPMMQSQYTTTKDDTPKIIKEYVVIQKTTADEII